jgi:hypothetical protein
MPLFSIVNIFVFQAAWFSAAILRDQAFWIMIPLLVLHFYFSPCKRDDLKLILLLLPLGMVVELILILTELVRYSSALVLPIWMVLLWLHLILSFNHSLKWLQTTYGGLVFVMGGVAGACSYAAASNFGAMQIASPRIYNLIVIALMWSVIVLISTRVAKYNNKEES